MWKWEMAPKQSKWHNVLRKQKFWWFSNGWLCGRHHGCFPNKLLQSFQYRRISSTFNWCLSLVVGWCGLPEPWQQCPASPFLPSAPSCPVTPTQTNKASFGPTVFAKFTSLIVASSTSSEFWPALMSPPPDLLLNWLWNSEVYSAPGVSNRHPVPCLFVQVWSRAWSLESGAFVTVWALLSTGLSSICSTWSWRTRTTRRKVPKPTWSTPPTRSAPVF